MNNNIPKHIRAGVKKKSIPIHYLVSKDASGRDCYFVLICPYQKLRLMLSGKECVKPEDYGYIVTSGFGTTPSRQEQDMLAEEYDFTLQLKEAA